MLNLLYLIFLISIIVLIIRKLHVIAVGVFFGGLILILSVTILRDQLHLPVNDYVDTTAIDNLRDTVVPVDFGENENDKVITVVKDDGTKEKVSESDVNYEYLSDEERQKLEERMKAILSDEPVDDIKTDTVDSEKLKENLITKEIESSEKLKATEKSTLEKSNNTLIFSYESDLKDVDSRKNVYSQISPLINDESFYSKFMGMSPFVNIEYDFSTGKMYNNDKNELVIVLYK